MTSKLLPVLLTQMPQVHVLLAVLSVLFALLNMSITTRWRCFFFEALPVRRRRLTA